MTETQTTAWLMELSLVFIINLDLEQFVISVIYNICLCIEITILFTLSSFIRKFLCFADETPYFIN